MNRYLLPLVAGLLAAVSLGNGAAHAETFQFVICNYSEVNAAAATSSRESPGSNQWVTEGWFIVESGTCKTIGTFNSGYFYYYAEVDSNPLENWGSDDNKTCVRYPGPFRYVSAGGDTCSNRELKGFVEKNVAPDVGKFTAKLY